MATINNPALSGSIQSLNGSGYLNKFLPMLINALFIIASLLTFFLLIFGAIQYLLSGGEKAAVESAKNRITHALIGLVLVFCVYALYKLIGDFFGLNLTTINLDQIKL